MKLALRRLARLALVSGLALDEWERMDWDLLLIQRRRRRKAKKTSMIVDFRSVPHVPSTEARNFPPLEFEFASGNSCTVTPSISEDPCYPGQRIVVFAYCWKNKPDQEDVSEIETLMTRLVFALRHQKKS